MDIWKTIKGYFWWTYPRGSVHYDVMVTLILAFIFVTPLFVDFKDKPSERLAHPTDIIVQADGERGVIYQLDASVITGTDDSTVRKQLVQVIEPIAGEITIDRYETTRGTAGHKVYKVWAHR